MKILFIHLSDSHIQDREWIPENIIEAQIRALNAVGDFERCIIIFSGDIAYSGKINEYKKAKYYLGSLWRSIKEKFDVYVDTFVVPGNHDMDFMGQERSRTQICEILNNGVNEDNINEELTHFNNFFEFAEYYKCFINDKLVDNRILKHKSIKIQINLINSELFSTFKDELNDDDKGKHYLPSREICKLEKQKDIDYCISISHRSHEWFEWESCNHIKRNINKFTDIFFYGHEHVDGIEVIQDKKSVVIKSTAKGINFQAEEINFNTVILDTEKDNCFLKQFAWDKENNMFKTKTERKQEIQRNKENDTIIEPNFDFLSKFVLDENGNDTEKYFVFPGLGRHDGDKYFEYDSIVQFLDHLSSLKYVVIEGDDLSGKTLLLKNIYLNLIGNKVPIYLNEDTFNGKDIRRAVKAAFEEQYEEGSIPFERFQQLDKADRVLLIDDYYKIKPRHLKAVEEYITENFGLVIVITKPKWDFDIIASVKEKLIGGEKTQKFTLLPFYAPKRQKLIENLYSLYTAECDPDKVYIASKRINDFIKDQVRLFSLNPQFISMYVGYCTRKNDVDSTTSNIFGKVFEDNLVHSMRRISPHTIDEYSFLLEEIAYEIHFKENYPISESDLSKIIDRYNSEYTMSVSLRDFCNVMIKAKVFKEEDNKYSFYNKNYLAYFVAKSLNTRYNNGYDNNELEIIANNICFNINGDILLFLSYITSNMRILKYIQKKSEEHMVDWEEFDIDKGNLKFITNTKFNTNVNMPTEKERKELEQREKKYEKEATKEEEIHTVSLYDYDKTKKELTSYKIGQAIRYTELLCKILPSFNHRLTKDDKSTLIANIFKFPNKIIYKIFKELDDDYDSLIKKVLAFCQDKEIDITEEDLRHDIEKGVETYILNLFDWYARLATNSKTISAINNFVPSNTNYKIERVMMLENLGAFNEFTSEADGLYESTKLVLVKSMIKRVIQKHFLCNKNLKIVGNVQSVADKYLGKNAQKIKFIK